MRSPRNLSATSTLRGRKLVIGTVGLAALTVTGVALGTGPALANEVAASPTSVSSQAQQPTNFTPLSIAGPNTFLGGRLQSNGHGVAGQAVALDKDGRQVASSGATDLFGDFEFSIGNLPAGTYTVAYAGNSSYQPVSTDYTIAPLAPTNFTPLTVSGNGTVIGADLQSDGHGLAGQQVVLHNLETRVTYEKATTGPDGSFTFNLGALPATTYQVEYSGTNGYSPASVIYNYAKPLSITDFTSCPPGGSQPPSDNFTGHLAAGDPGPVAGEKITVLLNGTEIGTTPLDAQGNFSYSAPAVSANSTYEFTYAGDQRTPAATTSYVVDFTSVSHVYNGTGYQGVLTDSNGTPLAGQTVSLYWVGTRIGTAVTNSSGVYYLPYNPGVGPNDPPYVFFTGSPHYQSSVSF